MSCLKVLSWVEHDHFAVQRAAAVLIYPVNKNVYKDLETDSSCGIILLEKTNITWFKKGYGWCVESVFQEKSLN